MPGSIGALCLIDVTVIVYLSCFLNPLAVRRIAPLAHLRDIAEEPRGREHEEDRVRTCEHRLPELVSRLREVAVAAEEQAQSCAPHRQIVVGGGQLREAVIVANDRANDS